MGNEMKFESALGMIETRGLVAAIEAADAMRKVAHVRLLCQEEIGGGYITTMIRGEIGAVNSAIDAGVSAAQRAGELISTHVIPKPHKSVEKIIHQGETAVLRALAD